MSTLGPRQLAILSSGQRDKIIELRRQSVPTRELAERFGVSQDVIRKISKGVKPEIIGCGAHFRTPMGMAGLVR